MPKHTVHWFRKGLRLHDNPSLREGLKGATTFRCIFILDPWFAGSSNVGVNKWSKVDIISFLNGISVRQLVIQDCQLRCLPGCTALILTSAEAYTYYETLLERRRQESEACYTGRGQCNVTQFCCYDPKAYLPTELRFLLQSLQDLDNNLRKLNSRLFVIRGQPADALPKLFKEWSTTNLTFEEDPEPFGRVRDKNITAMCEECNVSTVSRASHTLYDLDKVIELNGGSAPLTYHRFQTLVTAIGHPAQAEPAVTLKTIQGCYTPISEDHDDLFGVPTLEELGFDTANLKPAVWLGGETQALKRMKCHLFEKAEAAATSKASGRPKLTVRTLFASHSSVSPYLRFGCLSAKLFYHQLLDLFTKLKNSRCSVSLHGQLLWREFFYCLATRNPKFDQMQGNPLCLQIPWDKNAEATAKWANGQTGFPWIDAIMIQLKEEGWIHHVARNATACFLTRGDLWISWEEGMKVFDELLLDADWSVNAGMWMWQSCSSFFHQFSHCYCPVRFGRKADPTGEYIRRYIPVLRNFPTKYIHEPWRAPENVQKEAGCIVGKDYSRPMVEHDSASRINTQRMKQVYKQLSVYRGPGPSLSQSRTPILPNKFIDRTDSLYEPA